MNEKNRPVLFYDGECGLCSRSVRFLMRHDQAGLLFYAPLQGETAAHALDSDLRESLSTVVYRRTESEILIRSDAVLQAIIDMGSNWRVLARPALLIRRTWRDAVYNWIAARRNKFFSKGSCPLPSVEESDQLLP